MGLKIGLIGLDTSHVEIFARLLTNKNNSHFQKAEIVIGTPCPSMDISLSKTRVSDYTSILKNDYNVQITNHIVDVAENVDALLITALDGRKHLDIFRKVVHFQKPVFIDKPLCIYKIEAEEIFRLSKQYNTPVMTSSALRYSHMLTSHLESKRDLPTGVYINGPLPFIEHIPFYSWYGIHMMEVLFTIFGPDYKDITISCNNQYDILSIGWNNDRFGVIRGTRIWHDKFEVILHYKNSTVHLPLYKDDKTYYDSLLEKIIQFFQTKVNPIAEDETIAMIECIEKANNIRKSVS